jgi:hypothetical protein
MTYEYVDTTERIGDLILQVVADTSGAGDPRDGDNFTEMFGESRSIDIETPPDEHIRVLERIRLRGLVRFMRRFGDPRDGSKVLAIKQLGMYEHSGITVYTEEIGSRKGYVFDEAGWDTSHIGYVMITQKQWDMIGGGDPDEMVDGIAKIGFGSIPVKVRNADHVLELEIEEWDDWMRGNVWGFVITKPCDHADEHDSDASIADCPHSETIDSCWGFVGDAKYALEEGRAAAQ